jgi:hypothetical protein
VLFSEHLLHDQLASASSKGEKSNSIVVSNKKRGKLTQWIGGRDIAKEAAAALHGAEMRAQLGRVQAPFTATLKIFALHQVLLTVESAV